MIRVLVLFAFLVARTASAAFLPCSPVLIAGPQGRPIPNATVSVVNLDGSPLINGVWLNDTGTQPFTNTLPADQVLQVFADPGTYRVDISGAGLTKSYEIVCSEGFGDSVRKISISRSAELLLNTQPNAPTLLCPSDGSPCFQVFQQGIDSSVTFDFVAPTYPLTLQSFLITWFAYFPVNIPGTTLWRLDWCTYAEGNPRCSATGANAVDVLATSPGTGVGIRRDLLVLPTMWPLAWNPSDHVVIQITRRGSSLQDTLVYTAIENVRMELLK